MSSYTRDVNLPPKLAALYQPEMIICEKGFTDATNRFMGMPTTCRYVILSNHMVDISAHEHGTNWGLHIAKAEAHFKVLGKYEQNGKLGIFLLHLPDDNDWKFWSHVNFSTDAQVYQMAVNRFIEKCNAEIIPELADSNWLDRCHCVIMSE